MEVVGNGTYGQVYKVGWSAVHGLSCFHSAQCFFFFLLPLSSLGTMEVTVKRHVFHKCCHQTTPHVKGNGKIVMVFLVIVACFGYQSDQGVIQQGG